MEARFVNISYLVTYLGELDSESLKDTLIKVLGSGPKFIPRISEDVTLSVYNGYQMLKMEFLYYVEKGLFSDEEKSKCIAQLKSDIRTKVETELKNQKIIFNFEDN